MKKIFIFKTIITLLFITISTLSADWKQSTGPMGRKINFFVCSGKRIFAITNDSVFVSLDKGLSWSGINNGLSSEIPSPELSYRSLAVCDSNLFLNNNYGEYFYSKDYGKHWNKCSGKISGSPIWDYAAYDTILFAGTYGSGVFRSTDGGITWSAVNNGLDNFYISSMVVKDSCLFIRNDDGIFMSKNYGAVWTNIPTSGLYLRKITLCDTVLYGFLRAGPDRGLYRSADWGKTWTNIEDLPSDDIISIAVKGTKLFIGASRNLDGSMYYSSDNGESWIVPENNGLTNRDITALTVMDSTIILGTRSGGLYVSHNFGNGWTESNDGISASFPLYVTALASYDHQIIAGTYGGGLFLSSDNCESWSEINEGIDNKHILSLSVQDTRIYAATSQNSINISENGGINWSQLRNGLPEPGIVKLELNLAVYDTLVFAGFYSDGIYRSSDYGKSWTNINNNLPSQLLRDLFSLTANKYGLYAGGHGLYVSKNFGESWSSISKGLPFIYQEIINITTCDTNIFISDAFSGLYKSFVNHKAWTSINSGLPLTNTGHLTYNVECMDSNGEYTIAGLDRTAIYLLTEKNTYWKKVSEIPFDQYIYSLLVDETNVYVGLAGTVDMGTVGFWNVPLSEIVNGIEYSGNPLSSDYTLNQNYPNPFNPITIIYYSLPVSDQIDLSVFNILGQKVATLVNKKQAAGTYNVEFNASNLASGIYIYKLKTASFEKSKKMILLR